MNSNFRQQPPFPLKKQAEAIASKGRFGDSTLVHMNPMEVDVLRSMTPNNQLTINPDTGQPEAFLPLLLALGGGLLGAAAPIGALGALGGSVGLAALGSGIGTTIETGSLEEGIKAGLISGVLGGVGGRLFEGFGAAKDVATGVGQTTGQLGAEAGKQTAAEIAKTVGTENLITSTIPSAIPTTAAQSTSQMLAQEAAKSAALQPAVTAGAQEAVKQNIGQRLASGLAEATTGDLLGTAAAGITGEAMTDQFNLMNMPLPEQEEKEPFYVPVTPDDRGVRFRRSNTNPAGTSEFDYFSNPFTYSTGMKEGGVVGDNVRGLFRGGRASEGNVEAQIPADYDPLNPTGKYRPVSMATPSYFTDPMGTAAKAAAAASDQLGLTDPLGNRQFTLRDVVNTQQIYTPRADSPAITLGSRGFADAPVIDYNQRLLGDATRTFTTQEQIENPDYDPNAVAASTTGGGATTNDSYFNPDDIFAGPIMGQNSYIDFAGEREPYGIESFIPMESIMENLPGAYDPERGYMLPTDPGNDLVPDVVGFNPMSDFVMPQSDMGGFDPVMPVMDFAPVDFSSQMMGEPLMDFAPVAPVAPMMDFAPVAPVMDFASPPMDFAPPPMDFAPVAPVMDFGLPPVSFTPPVNFAAPVAAAPAASSFAPPAIPNFDFLGGMGRMKRGGLTG